MSLRRSLTNSNSDVIAPDRTPQSSPDSATKKRSMNIDTNVSEFSQMLQSSPENIKGSTLSKSSPPRRASYQGLYISGSVSSDDLAAPASSYSGDSSIAFTNSSADSTSDRDYHSPISIRRQQSPSSSPESGSSVSSVSSSSSNSNSRIRGSLSARALKFDAVTNADWIKELGKLAIDKIKKENTFRITGEELTKVLDSNFEHVSDEDIDIISMAAGAGSRFSDAELEDHPRAMYYEHGTNATLYQTGRVMINMPEYQPDQFAILDDSLLTLPRKENPKGYFLNNLSLKEKVIDEFNLTNSIVYVPDCFTTAHTYTPDRLWTIVQRIVDRGASEVIIYLGRDAGDPENVKLRDKWMSDHTEILNRLTKFARKNNATVRLMLRAELVTLDKFKAAESFFVKRLINHDPMQIGKPILSAIVKDMTMRMIQKKQIVVSPKPTALNGAPKTPVLNGIPNVNGSPQKKRNNKWNLATAEGSSGDAHAISVSQPNSDTNAEKLFKIVAGITVGEVSSRPLPNGMEEQLGKFLGHVGLALGKSSLNSNQANVSSSSYSLYHHQSQRMVTANHQLTITDGNNSLSAQTGVTDFTEEVTRVAMSNN